MHGGKMLFGITSNSDDISDVKYSPDISIRSNLAIVTKYLETIEIVKMKLLNLSEGQIWRLTASLIYYLKSVIMDGKYKIY